MRQINRPLLCSVRCSHEPICLGNYSHSMEFSFFSRNFHDTQELTAEGERSDLDHTRELRAQTTSEVLLNTTTSRPESERLAEVTSERTAVVEILENSTCFTNNEVSNQPRNIVGSQERDLSNLKNVNVAVDNCASMEENKVVNSKDFVIAEDDNSSTDNNKTSDSYYKDKENECSAANANNMSHSMEKQSSSNNSGDLDKLLEDFTNNSDILDDSLLDIGWSVLDYTVENDLMDISLTEIPLYYG